MKGMRKIRRGSGFRGVLSYLLDHDDPEFIAGTVPGGTAKQMTQEFVALSQTRSDIAKPVWHNSLRLPAGEHLDNAKWADIAADYMREMGFDDAAQWVAIKHNLHDGEHIHIVANRVQPDGSIYLGKNDNFRSTRIIAGLEKKYGLTITQSADYDEQGSVVMPEKSNPTKNEIDKSMRTGKAPERSLLQSVIDEALSARPTVTDFTDRLQTAGVSVRPNIASTGRVNGLAFELNGLTFSGSKLGKKYSWSKLQKRIDYKPDRDNALLQKLKIQAQKNDEIKAGAEASPDTEPAAPAAGADSAGAGPANGQDDQPARTVSRETPGGDPKSGAAGRETEGLAGRPDRSTDDNRQRAHNAGNKLTQNGEHIMDNELNNQSHPDGYNDESQTRHRREDEALVRKKKQVEAATSGRQRDPASVSSTEMQRFKKMLELAFEQRGSEYYYKGSDRLAFVDEGEKIVGSGLFNDDGSINRNAVKAMAQASQIKFGNEFHMTGSDKYKREMWLQAAMIGCAASGYEPDHNDLAELKKRGVDYFSKYKRKPRALHPDIEQRMERFERDLAEARVKLNPNQKTTIQSVNGVKSQLNAWRAERKKQPSQGRGLAPKLPKPN